MGNAQSVGLVMSGGGAKGAAYLGMLQALEDNEIPVDYVTGTSIGAVVSGLYAMGMTPMDMLKLFTSKEFNTWMTGTTQNEIDYFRKYDDIPSTFHTEIAFKDSIRKGKLELPTSLFDPVQMNFAFLQLTAQHTARCNSNLDSLFVPFRSVASDVEDRKAYVFRKGDLGQAIRASMTFPFIFKALKVDGHILYDGGIYNNFPIDVLIKEFNPDIVIGAVVAEDRVKPDENNPYAQLVDMIMNKPDYSLPKGTNGILLRFDMRKFSLLDFEKADSAFNIGYSVTTSKIDSIKRLIHRRIKTKDLNRKREEYLRSLPELTFNKVEIEGCESNRCSKTGKKYVKEILFQGKIKKKFSLDDVKEGYFNLVANNKIKELQPYAVYNPKDSAFTLIIKTKINDNLKLDIGGNLSLTNANQLYLNVEKNILSKISQTYRNTFILGDVTRSVGISSKFIIESKVPKYIKTSLKYQNFSYHKSEKFFYEDNDYAYIRKREAFFKLKYGVAIGNKSRIEIGVAPGLLTDYYTFTNDTTTQTYRNKNKYNLIGASAKLEGNSLDSKIYPTSGSAYKLIFQMYRGYEKCNNEKNHEKYSSWQLSAEYENYSHFSSDFILGEKISSVYKKSKNENCYKADIIQAPGFTPTPHSKSIFNEGYHSSQFFTAGVVPIYKLKNVLYLRGDFYGFFPIQIIKENITDNTSKTLHSVDIDNAKYIAEAALILDLKKIYISMFINNYSYPKNNWNFGINIGLPFYGDRYFE